MEEISKLFIPHNEFITIDYPLIINNEEKAFKMLGGLTNIMEILQNNEYEKDKKRFKLNFRPDNVYSNPIISEMSETNIIILKVKQFKNKKTNEIKIVSEILGLNKHLYEFNTICDYQFSPHDSVAKVDDDSAVNSKVFYEKLIPHEPFSNSEDFAIFINLNNKIFLPPSNFTRGEKPTDSRLFKCSNNLMANFNDANRNYKIETNSKDYITIKELFDIQPMWTTSSIKDHLLEKGVTNMYKMIQYRNTLADHIINGIWRRSWSRKNYDYRKTPESRIYQIVEYRGNLSHINYIKKYIRHSEQNKNNDTKIFESVWKIGTRFLPSSTNCFYQLHDIEIPEIVELLNSEPIPKKCHEEWGWFTSDVISKCRNIIYEYVASRVDALINESIPTPMEVDSEL